MHGSGVAVEDGVTLFWTEHAKVEVQGQVNSEISELPLTVGDDKV